MNEQLIGAIIAILILFFIFGAFFIFFTLIILFIVLLRKSLRKSDNFRKFNRKLNAKFIGFEEIPERLDDIAEIKKSNEEILEKLDYLMGEKNKDNI